MPGIADISGYRPAAYLEPSVLISYDQMKIIIDTFTNKSTQVKEDYESYMSRQPIGSTNDIPKKAVYVKFRKEASDDQINRMKNDMVKLAGDTNAIAFDAR